MKLVIQRVKSANVKVDNEVVGAIKQGLVVLVALEITDNELSIDKTIQKLLKLRVFADDRGKINLSTQDTQAGILLISQFTLNASLEKGHRPSFNMELAPEVAQKMFERFIEKMREQHEPVACGIFAADMLVSLENDGPVTFYLEIR